MPGRFLEIPVFLGVVLLCRTLYTVYIIPTVYLAVETEHHKKCISLFVLPFYSWVLKLYSVAELANLYGIIS